MEPVKMTDYDPEDLGRRLAEARLNRTLLPVSSVVAPPDVAAAVQAQAAFFHRCAANVPGWKVGISPDGFAVAAPMWPLNEAPGDAPIEWKPGMSVEVEIAARLGKDLTRPPEGLYRRADIVDAIESLYLGVELLSSRFDRASPVKFLLAYADLLGNDGYVLGPAIPNAFLENIEQKTLTIRAGAKPFYSGLVKHPTVDPLAPIVAYANASHDLLGGLRAGQIVTTGSLCGALPLPEPSRLEIRIADCSFILNFQRLA
jgi:2-keto-4-pentenoate hydratase